MALSTETPQAGWTAVDLVERFGAIPLGRIRHDPPPGAATEADVIAIHEREDRLYELVDGVLVEKTVGYLEAWLAARMIILLGSFVDRHRLGVVAGADGMMRLAPGLVRIPDVSFVAPRQLRGGRIPRTPIARLVPDLAIEVLSKGNTRKEMDRKLIDYFAAGARLVWYVDPEKQTVRAYTAPDRSRLHRLGQVLDGGDVVPGYRLPLRELFAEPGPPDDIPGR